MKKFAIAIMCVLSAVAFTSCQKDVDDMDLNKCDKETYKCWNYTVKYEGKSDDTYMWGTEYDVVFLLKAAKKSASVLGYDAKVTYKAASKYDTADKCAEAATNNALN